MSEELDGLNLVDLYDQLVMPATPEPISMLPQTAGWIWLLLILAAAIAVGTIKLRAQYRANAYRRAALSELQTVGDDPAAIAGILRRTAVAGFPRADVAALTGEDWLSFLEATAPGFHLTGSEAGAVLATAPYRPHSPHPDLPGLAQQWIKTHHVKRKRA